MSTGLIRVVSDVMQMITMLLLYQFAGGGTVRFLASVKRTLKASSGISAYLAFHTTWCEQ